MTGHISPLRLRPQDTMKINTVLNHPLRHILLARGDILSIYTIKLKSIIIYILIFVAALTAANIFSGSNDAAFQAEAEGEGEDSAKLPIIMYHAICENNSKSSRFVIKKQALENDLKYIKENGYTTVSFAELVDYVENNAELPEKPIMLTFDDGYFNNYCYAYPLLEEYNAKAIISIIGKYTDLYSETTEENPSYSHITWTQAREMCESGLVEIQNHSYNSHTNDRGRNGTKKKKGESKEAYSQYMYDDVGKLQSEIKQNLGYTPELFTYPFGSVSEASYDILKKMGFKGTLSCGEKINTIRRGDNECLYMLGRYIRSDKISVKDILEKNMK